MIGVSKGRLRGALITGVAAAATTGIASAVVTRMLMRATALVLREPTSFSLAGSAGIGLIYIVALLPGCIALASTRHRWAWAVLAAGCVLLLFSAVNIGYAETASAHDLTAVRIAGLALVLTAMVGVYALQMYTAARWATRRRYPKAGTTARFLADRDRRTKPCYAYAETGGHVARTGSREEGPWPESS